MEPSPVSANTIYSATLFPRRHIGPELSTNLFRLPGLPSEVSGPRKDAVHSAGDPLRRTLVVPAPPCHARAFRGGALDSLCQSPCCWSEQVERIERPAQLRAADQGVPPHAAVSAVSVAREHSCTPQRLLKGGEEPRRACPSFMSPTWDIVDLHRPSSRGPLCLKLRTNSVSTRTLVNRDGWYTGATGTPSYVIRPASPRDWRARRHSRCGAGAHRGRGAESRQDRSGPGLERLGHDNHETGAAQIRRNES